jgi:hypothetical protein
MPGFADSDSAKQVPRCLVLAGFTRADFVASFISMNIGGSRGQPIPASTSRQSVEGCEIFTFDQALARTLSHS